MADVVSASAFVGLAGERETMRVSQGTKITLGSDSGLLGPTRSTESSLDQRPENCPIIGVTDMGSNQYINTPVSLRHPPTRRVRRRRSSGWRNELPIHGN